jgi:hypothetical protein
LFLQISCFTYVLKDSFNAILKVEVHFMSRTKS